MNAVRLFAHVFSPNSSKWISFACDFEPHVRLKEGDRKKLSC